MQPTPQRNRRAAIIGALAAAAILLLTYGLFPWIELRREIADLETSLDQLAFDQSPAGQVRRDLLLRAVPCFELPAPEDQQRIRLLRSFTDQLKKAGLNLPDMPAFKAQALPLKDLDVKLLQLESHGTCKLEQAFDVLAGLYHNPHLVALDQLTLECASEDRQQWRLAMTVSTFVD